MKTKTNEQQIGGNHYERLKIEPVKIIAAFNLNWFQGEILKYVSRFPYKGGKNDLLKATHISQMAIDLKIHNKQVRRFSKFLNKNRWLGDIVEDFRKQFDYEEYITVILIGLVEENYTFVKERVQLLIDKYYE